jgi:hypothetical protein
VTAHESLLLRSSWLFGLHVALPLKKCNTRYGRKIHAGFKRRQRLF